MREKENCFVALMQNVELLGKLGPLVGTKILLFVYPIWVYFTPLKQKNGALFIWISG